MKRLFSLCAAAAAAAISVSGLVAAPAVARELPVEAYARLPDVQSVTISPNGDKLAMFIGSTREERSILFVSLDGSPPVRVSTNGEAPLDLVWFNNDRIGVYFKKFVSRFGGNIQGNQTRLVSISADGKDIDEIAPAAGVTSFLWDDPDHVLMSAPEITRRSGRAASSGNRSSRVAKQALYKVNVKNGRADIYERGELDTIAIFVDENDEPYMRLAAEQEFARKFEYFRVEAKDSNGNWRVAYELTDAPTPNGGLPINIAGKALGQNIVYFIKEYETDEREKLYQLNLDTGQIKEAFSRPDMNVIGMGRDPYSGLFLGVMWFDDDEETNYFTEGLQRLHDELNAAFPGSTIDIQNWDRNYRRFVIRIQGGQVSDGYFLFNGDTGQIQLIANGYPDVPGEEVAPWDYITYTARDGMTIPAYVTYPVDRERRNLPLVVLPHGGPEARDFPSFDFWPQMLANRGYVVLQPQFRGSDGYGDRFIKAGWQKWGQEMQTDLTDGVRHLVSQGVVDPARVCIFGWSYGGYAAMAGATLDAETYRCAAGGAPVTDLKAMLDWVNVQTGSRNRASKSFAIVYWQRAIGDLRDEERLARFSPAKQVANVRGPVLLIHGDRDTTVPIEQSEIMAKALRDAGKEYEFVVLEDEDHNITFGETRVQMMRALDEFLKRSNPPR